MVALESIAEPWQVTKPPCPNGRKAGTYYAETAQQFSA